MVSCSPRYILVCRLRYWSVLETAGPLIIQPSKESGSGVNSAKAKVWQGY